MYTNKYAWTNKDGTYKEVYYYVCSRNRQVRGHQCDYKAALRKTDIEPLVVEAVRELVRDQHFTQEMKRKIGGQIDTSNIDKKNENYEAKLKEVDLNKVRLEREIDNFPIDARYRERKILTIANLKNMRQYYLTFPKGYSLRSDIRWTIVEDKGKWYYMVE